MLLLELFDNSPDEINQNSITTSNSHPPFNPLHNLTPSSLHVKLPLNIPIIPSVSKFHPSLSYPIYIFLYIFLNENFASSGTPINPDQLFPQQLKFGHNIARVKVTLGLSNQKNSTSALLSIPLPVGGPINVCHATIQG